MYVCIGIQRGGGEAKQSKAMSCRKEGRRTKNEERRLKNKKLRNVGGGLRERKERNELT
jgi:hypothetical protein